MGNRLRNANAVSVLIIYNKTWHQYIFFKNIKSFLLCTFLAIIKQGLFRDKLSSTKINSADQTTEDKTHSSNIVLHKDRQKKFEADSKKTPSLGKIPEILYAVLREVII